MLALTGVGSIDCPVVAIWLYGQLPLAGQNDGYPHSYSLSYSYHYSYSYISRHNLSYSYNYLPTIQTKKLSSFQGSVLEVDRRQREELEGHVRISKQKTEDTAGPSCNNWSSSDLHFRSNIRDFILAVLFI